jgi:photosystem II stability/assembly factor-like uncharacterized protein
MGNVLTAGMGALWIQIGTNREPQYLGCHAFDELSQGKGDKTLIWCKDPSGPDKFVVAGSFRGAKEPAKFSIEIVLQDTADFLETVADQECNIYVNKYIMGKADLFTNYDRSNILSGVLITQESEKGLVARDPGDNAPHMATFEMSADEWFKAIPMTVARQSVVDANNGQVIRFYDSNVGYFAAKAAALGKSKVYITENGGGAWSLTATQPFAADEDIISMSVFPIDRNTHRVLVVRDDDVAAAIKVAYSDDGGDTWHLVTVGSTNGQKALGQRALFTLDVHHIWLVTSGGFVYFSNNGGVTWSTQDAAAATTADLYAVHFTDSTYGVAVGATDKVLVTSDGGTTWSLATASGSGATLWSCFRKDANNLWVSGAAGGGNTLWYSEDGGTTWDGRAFSGGSADSTAGIVKVIDFVNDLIGFIAHQSAGPVGTILRTRDGGYTWEAATTPSNAGLTSLEAMNVNRVSVCGPASGGTAFIAKASNTLGG